jgi:hypothetical protein
MKIKISLQKKKKEAETIQKIQITTIMKKKTQLIIIIKIKKNQIKI